MARLQRGVEAALARPRLAVGLFLVLTAGWLLALPRLYLATDGRSLFPRDHPALEFQRRVDATFAVSDFVVVGLAARGGQGVYAPAPLNWVLRLSGRLDRLPGVAAEGVRSLATVVSPSWSAAGLRLEPPLVERVRDAAAAQAVRRRVEADPLLPRVLTAGDRQGVAVYVPLAAGTDRRRLLRRIAAIAEQERSRMPAGEAERYTVHLLGPAAAESLLGGHVLGDLALLLPLSLAVVALLFWLWFRQLSVVAVGLGEAGSVVIWSLGLMGLLGKGVSLVTVVMPVILATYCVADTIHIAQRFQHQCAAAAAGSRRAALATAMGEVLRPVVFTSLTTAAGFLSFVASPIPPLRDFGLFSAFGILSALGVSLFVVPPALLLTGFGRPRATRPMSTAATRAVEGLVLAAARRPRGVVCVTVLACLLAGGGLLRLRVQDSWVHNFSAASPLPRSDRWFNAGFLGSNVLHLIVDRGAPDGVYDPAFLAALERLESELARSAAVGGSLSLADQMRAVARTLEGAGRLPRSRAEAAEWALLLRMAGGAESLGSYVDARGGTTNLWIFLNRADYRRTAEVIAAVERFAWPVGTAPAAPVRFAGDAYLGYLLVGAIASSQGLSLVLALALNLLAAWWMLRSLPAASLAVLPVGIAVWCNFGFMGWVGMPLGIATSTFSAIALGIGIDFALHWIARLRLATARGESGEAALRTTAGSAGAAVLANGVVLLCGFAVLGLSRTPPTRGLGVLLCVNLAVCLAATLAVLPAGARAARAARWPAPLLAVSGEGAMS